MKQPIHRKHALFFSMLHLVTLHLPRKTHHTQRVKGGQEGGQMTGLTSQPATLLSPSNGAAADWRGDTSSAVAPATVAGVMRLPPSSVPVQCACITACGVQGGSHELRHLCRYLLGRWQIADWLRGWMRSLGQPQDGFER